MLSPWWRKLLTNSFHHFTRRSERKRGGTVRLGLENLEDRVTPASLHWIGGDAVNPTAWSAANNWQEGVQPTNGDTVVFDSSVVGLSSFTSNNDINSLTLGGIIISDTDAAANHDFTISGAAVTLT